MNTQLGEDMQKKDDNEQANPVLPLFEKTAVPSGSALVTPILLYGKRRIKKEKLAEFKQAYQTHSKSAYEENPDIKETPTGLQYRVLTEGNGESPKKTDRVKVHYLGKLMDGSEFDSSIERGEPTEFALNQVIKGWTEGLQLMKVGSKYEFFIHPNIAYGQRARPKIPANSVLIFEVELLDIVSKK